MALADALEELLRQWSTLVADLDASQQRLIRRQLAAAVHGARWDPDLVLRTAMTAQPDDHPVWEALARSPVRREQTSGDPRPLIAAARLRLALESGAGEREDRRLGPDDAERAAEQRLWTVPMTPAQRRHGEHVLVLERDSGLVAPRFQFDPDGVLIGAVAVVNELLDVDEDPWGAASWWLTPHAALHAIPADEVRTGSADKVLAAARALGAFD